MNRVYLFGKVIFKSKLKYAISPKLKVYMEIVIETISGDKFNCIIDEKIISKLKLIDKLDYAYIEGHASFTNKILNIIVTEVYMF